MPALVVIESGPLSVRRLVSRFRHPDDDTATICRRLGWRLHRVETLDSPAAIAAISAAGPDLAVNAGAGILRRPVLAAPRFGTLGVHMGLLRVIGE
jgi:methionyl-tRNA formyltransferase